MKRADAHVLVAEDSSTMRMCVCWVLRQLGVGYVDEAMNGALAFTMFRRKRYDLIITDWEMPLVDGLDLLRAVRGGKERSDTPVLMLTAPSDIGSLHQAIGSGATGFVPKPRLNPSLSEQVTSVITRRPAFRPEGRIG